jgi:DNA-nicking Smr family endonuclease
MKRSVKKKDKNPVGENPAFQHLAELVTQAGIRLQEDERAAEPEPELPGEPEDEEELFARAMEGVARSSWRQKPLVSPPPVKPQAGDPQLENLQLMKAAVNGETSPLVLDHPEYIEGWIGVAGKRYLPNLRNGIYSIQAQLDLHGQGRAEARLAVEEFVARMSHFRSCCVKIIHGRGINSPNDQAILKESLQRWLCTRRMSHYVVAYASAPLNDGGVGAVYVLLRGTHRH